MVSNINDLKSHLINSINTNFINYINSNSNLNYNKDDQIEDKLSYKIAQAILYFDPSRLDSTSNNLKKITSSTDFQPLPIGIGDKIIIPLTINDYNTHFIDLSGNTYNSNEHGNSRIYAIEITIN